MTNTLEITSVQIAAIGLVLTAVVSLWSLFKLVTSSAESVRKELLAEIDKTDALASKGRHELANLMQVQLTKMETELDRLRRETVRREDMAAIEGRLTSMFTKIETKVDVITERLAQFPALEKQVQSIDSRLDGAIRRLEGRN